jgi:hypothetical protein
VYTRTILLALLLLFLCAAPGTQAQTASCTPPVDSENPFSCFITYTPTGPNIGVFDFSGFGDGILTIQFDTILDTFTLTVTANEVASITNIDQTQLPGATCITYANGHCVRYDVTGNVSGPNGTPVRGVDYRGLVTLFLNYDSFERIDIPVFGHDPELDPNFDENILTFYVDENAPACTNGCEEPGMGGKTPGISGFAALTEPFANAALTVCPQLTATPQNSTSGNNPLIEVTFQLVAAGGNCHTGPFLRDKTASLSVGTEDTNGNIVPTTLVNGGDANKFHFDNRTGLNVQDINTNGLASGTYLVTVSSSVFSPVTTTFTIP